MNRKAEAVPGPPQAAGWDASWEGHERDQLRRWLEATPAQRLAWLEDAIEFAWRAGALARRHGDEDRERPGR